MLIGYQWHEKKLDEVFDLLSTNERGLAEKEALRLLGVHGPNKLPEAKRESLVAIFLNQFRSPLIYLLLAASAVIFAIGELTDGIIILAVLIFNAVVGAIQEGRAQNTLRALRTFVLTNATVLRDGVERIVPDTDLVPGDIIFLEEGEKVPADARVIESRSLRVDEAALSGESEAVYKVSTVVRAGAGEYATNIVFKGTHIASGSGSAVVVATGVDTAIGRIARKISTVDAEIPLKANIRHLSRLIISVVAVISALLFTAGVMTGKGVVEMFTTVVSLSVSVIPEGLPIVMTLVLASGVWRMSKRNALVKKLQAVEALGQARIIAVDKTGTITKNELVVQKIFVGDELFDVSGVGYEPSGVVTLQGKPVTPSEHRGLSIIGEAAVLCSTAHVIFVPEPASWRVSGDPTEAALVVAAKKLGIEKGGAEQLLPLVSEIPFDYRTKFRATSRSNGHREQLTAIGAPEVILERSTKYWSVEREHVMGVAERRRIEAMFHALSAEGLRVIAVAVKHSAPATFTERDVSALTFVGFYAMKDALRIEVNASLQKARAAGMRVVMITGDHRITAEAIAREAGILSDGDTVLTGSELEKLSDDELAGMILSTSVFARVTPDHKLRIIEAYRRNGSIVAMTGDGVNDAPSLVAADLGVAMGGIGTEVAKEAADIVLLDDNFGSIVSAVEEGRGIYKTMKKVILYLFSTSAGEVLAITGALFLGFPLPLLPAQIIWLNFVTDGFLDVALAMEPKEKNLLSGSFERPKKYLIDMPMTLRMLTMALPMAFGALYLFSQHYEADLTKALTMSLTVLAVFQWFNVWNCRSDTESVFRMNPFTNKYLLGATGIVISLQLLAVYHPFFQKVLNTTPLLLSDWAVIVAIALSVIAIEETRKFFARTYFRTMKN